MNLCAIICHVRRLITSQFDAKVAAITVSLRDRMRFYKLRVTPNATRIASTFNEQFKPEIIAEYNDPYRVEWLDHTCHEDVLIGDQASEDILIFSVSHRTIGLASCQSAASRIYRKMAYLWKQLQHERLSFVASDSQRSRGSSRKDSAGSIGYQGSRLQGS